MQILCLPKDQLFRYVLTGKFKAPSEDWKHENFDLVDYELFVMTEGTLYLSYNNENFTIKKGEYLLLPPSDSWRQGFKRAYSSFYWLHFTTVRGNLPVSLTPDTAMPSDDCYFTLPQTGTIPKPEKLTVLMKQLQDIVKSGYPSIALDSMTTSVLTELFGQLKLLSDEENTSDNLKQIHLDIIDYIKRNISSNMKVSDIASTFGYNDKYLSHRFAEITGIPLKQYILKTKIESANFMLNDTNKSIAEISKELGFPDSHNFSRTYKNITGLTPSEYRNAFSKRLLYNV